jgi:hypothetical protein
MDNVPVHKVAGVKAAIEAVRLSRRIGLIVADFSARAQELLLPYRPCSNLCGTRAKWWENPPLAVA